MADTDHNGGTRATDDPEVEEQVQQVADEKSSDDAEALPPTTDGEDRPVDNPSG
jgi:hypothetical protein